MELYKQYRTLFHWPLPLAVIAIVTFGAIVSPTIYINRLIITYLLVLFGLVLAAYSLDALSADWKFLIVDIPKWLLYTLAGIGIAGFIITAGYAIITTSLTGIIVAIILLTSVVSYNLEIPKIVHNQYGFSLSWGAAAIISSYYYESLQISWFIVLLGITGFLIGMQEWYTTNTKSPMQKAISNIITPERKVLRKNTFLSTNLMCYSLFALSMTLLAWRLSI